MWTNKGRIRQSFIIYQQCNATLCCKCWQRTDSFEWEYYLGRPHVLLMAIKPRLSNAILNFLTLRGLGMLGLDQQWQGSSWWSSRLLQMWCSRSTVLRRVFMPRLEQADSLSILLIHWDCWVSLVLECKISISTGNICKQVLSLAELFRRDSVLMGEQSCSFFPFSFPIIFFS